MTEQQESRDDELLLRALVLGGNGMRSVAYDVLDDNNNYCVSVYHADKRRWKKSKTYYDHFQRLEHKAQTGPMTAERVGKWLADIVNVKYPGLDPESEAAEVEFLNRVGRQVLNIVYASRRTCG